MPRIAWTLGVIEFKSYYHVAKGKHLISLSSGLMVDPAMCSSIQPWQNFQFEGVHKDEKSCLQAMYKLYWVLVKLL